MSLSNQTADSEFKAAFDKRVSPRIQPQIIHLLTAIYYKLCAIEERA